MTDMTNAEIFAAITRVANAPDNTNFEDLVRLSGLDPKKDFVLADMSGIDLRHVDLSGYNLTGCRISSGALPEGIEPPGVLLVEKPFMPRDMQKKKKKTHPWIARAREKLKEFYRA